MMSENINRVYAYIPKGYAAEERNYFVSINGISYVLPRGKRALVPDFIAAEIQRIEHDKA